MPSRLYSHLQEYGVRDTAERVLCKLTHALLRSGFRKRDAPYLGELAAAASSVHLSADGLISALSASPISSDDLAALRREYEDHREALLERYRTVTLTYDAAFAIEEGSAFLMYALVRLLRPSVVLETGVANGHSSALILNALGENGSGELHSIDVSHDVGNLVLDKRQWHVHLLDLSSLKKSFAAIVGQLPAIDLMIHDSDHSYQWMRYELETVFPRMSPRGILACDDANICYGLIDFCAAHNMKPVLLMEKRKVFGIMPLKPLPLSTPQVRHTRA
jgi:predicted O-methyltransferase YrrM